MIFWHFNKLQLYNFGILINYNYKIQAKLETCVSNDFDEKMNENTKHFNEELRKIKAELEAAKETIQLNMQHIICFISMERSKK